MTPNPKKPTRGPGRPKKYLTSSGREVPGVTSIISEFKGSEALLGWANKIGLEGTTLKEHRKLTRGTGRLAHSVIEDYTVGIDSTGKLVCDQEAQNCFKGYLQFREMFDGEFLEVEVPLVSERFGFGGTIDWIANWRGKVIVGDWKSANHKVRFFGGYVDNLIQLGGYAQLWWENRQQVFDSAHVVYLVKDDPEDFEGDRYVWKTYDRQQLKLAHEQFLAFRECYERNRQLKDAI